MTKDIKEAYIQAKDERLKDLNAFLQEDQITITLSAIRIGLPKNTPMCQFLIKYFDQLIQSIILIKKRKEVKNAASNSVFYHVKGNAYRIKNQMMYIEDNHPLGRFIDVDVYDKTHPLTRDKLNKPLRKCLICHNPAHLCHVKKLHSYQELNQIIDDHVNEFIGTALAEETVLALRKELFLYPKFGLVSHKDSGIHQDMQKVHFLKSIEALKPFFKKFASFDYLNEPIKSLRKLGQDAEKHMYQATSGINTHKGAIFIFGALLPFYRDHLIKGLSLNKALKTMTNSLKDMMLNDFKTIKDPQTTGEKLYIERGLKGVRGELLKGFITVLNLSNYSFNHYQKLMYLISEIDDTTAIKRMGYQDFTLAQKDFKDFLNQPFEFKQYEELSSCYKEKRLSPGGAADLLALRFFFEATQNLFQEE